MLFLGVDLGAMRSARIAVAGLVMLAACAGATADAVVKGGMGWRTTSYDIHMKVSPQVADYVERGLAPEIERLLPHNEINFTKTIPHITLYMTSFMTNEREALAAAFKRTAARLFSMFPACNVTMARAAPSGQYYLWHSKTPLCLQAMSDALVRDLSPFRDVNQSVPKWLDTVPEPQRSQMIEMHKQFGSPGVFQFFDPHVTVAWDAVEPTTPLDALSFPPLNMTITQLAIGTTTKHGAVLRNRDLAAYPPLP